MEKSLEGLDLVFMGVISRSDTVELTAELEGVLKFFDARRTFQN
jgi:hypothetical protein